jgi:hypothetical protein
MRHQDPNLQDFTQKDPQLRQARQGNSQLLKASKYVKSRERQLEIVQGEGTNFLCFQNPRQELDMLTRKDFENHKALQEASLNSVNK